MVDRVAGAFSTGSNVQGIDHTIFILQKADKPACACISRLQMSVRAGHVPFSTADKLAKRMITLMQTIIEPASLSIVEYKSGVDARRVL